MATVVSSPSIAAMGTAVTADMSADGFTWANVNQGVTIDQHGKLFCILQKLSSGSVYFVYSNDHGATWNDGLSQGFITRGAWALDTTNDIVHCLWAATDVSDGAIYRRYTISRDGSNNITGFTRDLSVNLQVDYNQGTTTVQDIQFPVILWLDDAAFGSYGAVVCTWTIGTSAGYEARSSMRVLTNTAADNTAANWAAPTGTTSVDVINNDPMVPYTMVASRTGTGDSSRSVACMRKPSDAATHALDLYWGFNNNGNWQWRRAAWNSGSNNWSGGITTAATLSAEVRAGSLSHTGYILRWQLITKWQYDATNDRMHIAFPTWKSDTDGDGVSTRWVNGDDSLGTLVDVYYDGIAAVASTRFPVCDISWDATWGRLIVAYVHLSTKHAYVKVYNGATVEQAETLLFSTQPVDIPCLGDQRLVVSGQPDKMMAFFRDFDGVDGPFTPPYIGYWGTMTFEVSPIDLTGYPVIATLTAVSPTVRVTGGTEYVDMTAFPLSVTLTAIEPTVLVTGGGENIDLLGVPVVMSLTATEPTIYVTGLGLEVDLADEIAGVVFDAVAPTVIISGSLVINLAGQHALVTLTAITPVVGISGIPEPFLRLRGSGGYSVATRGGASIGRNTQ